MRQRQCPPDPACILESLRGLGYTLPTAIADLIDNSISANATCVDIRFPADAADPWISLTDNGHGMDDSRLEEAMRIGARDPRGLRDESDLGRFGLGLKTASLSQGRRLTVASKQPGGSLTCLRWDLDLLLNGQYAGWTLFEGAAEGSTVLIDHLDSMESGTVVLIEKLDRLLEDKHQTSDLVRMLDELDAHLSMVFHRLLESKSRGLRITINGKDVRPWDPFMLGHPGKAFMPPEYKLPGEPTVVVQPHVLPHRDLLTADEFEHAAGPGGWIQQQGIYVYRNRRMLVAGGWLGLGEDGRVWTRDEPHRLARIRLDIQNSEDSVWKIDVRKSTATPPSRLRKQLVRLIGVARAEARRAFAGRGVVRRTTHHQAGGVPDPWTTVRGSKGTSYRIARDHDLIASILDRSGPLKADLLAMFRLLEESLPVQRIWVDTAEERETPRIGFANSDDTDVLKVLTSLFTLYTRRQGMTAEQASARLSRTPHFHAYSHLIETLDAKGLETT